MNQPNKKIQRAPQIQTQRDRDVYRQERLQEQQRAIDTQDIIPYADTHEKKGPQWERKGTGR